MVNLCSLIYIVTCLSYKNEVFFMLAVQQLPSDSVESSLSQPWKEVLSIWICIIGWSVYPSIFHCFIPWQGRWGGVEPAPASFGQKTGELVSLSQDKQSHLTSISSLQFVCLPNACLWTVAESQNTQITHADAGENTQTQYREEPVIWELLAVRWQC